MKGVLTVDIDGTLTMGHGWFYIAEMLGRGKEYRSTTASYRNDSIDEGEHLQNLLNIAEGCTLGEMSHMLSSVPRLDRIGEGVAMLRKRGLAVALLTHNPWYICEWYMRQYGFDLYSGTEQEVSEGRITRASGAEPDKKGGLMKICRQVGVSCRRAVHAGDSISDARVFEIAGAGISVNAGDIRVRKRANAVLNTDDFMDVAVKMLHLMAREECEEK